MRKINYTKREFSPHLLLLFAELSLISAIGDLKHRSRYTKKWNELLAELSPIVDKTHNLVSFLDDCFQNSSVPENELNSDKMILFQLIEIIENVDDIPQLRSKIGDISKYIASQKKKK